MSSKLQSSACIGDAAVLPFQRPDMTKVPKAELYPIVKIEEYSKGKVQKTYWCVRSPDGTEAFAASYDEAAAIQQAKMK